MNAVVVERSDVSDPIVLKLKNSELDIHICGYFQEELDVIPFVIKNNIDLVIIDVEYMGVRAFQLGEQLKKRITNLMIVYCSDANNYMAVLEAVRTQTAAYVIKPFLLNDLEYAIETAKFLLKRKDKRIFARTFGNFELFVDEKPVLFKSSKAKELLALLVDRRGGIVTSEQAIGTLWEYRANDEASRSLYSKVGKSLSMTLEEVGAEELVMTSRGMRSIDINQLDCDLYQLLDGNEKVKMNYFGRYMMDYSWAEYRISGLNRLCGIKE